MLFRESLGFETALCSNVSECDLVARQQQETRVHLLLSLGGRRPIWLHSNAERLVHQ
jgi:hypothetical protein